MIGIYDQSQGIKSVIDLARKFARTPDAPKKCPRTAAAHIEALARILEQQIYQHSAGGVVVPRELLRRAIDKFKWHVGYSERALIAELRALLAQGGA